MTRKPASSLREFRSLAFVFTISMTCFRVTLPTFVLFGSFEPAAMFAAFFKRTAAGGLLGMKVNDLSLKTVMTTGRMSPACFWVAALNSLQNAMMLTPRGPSAVPTGGAGVACPAGICNFTNPVTFFAIALLLSRRLSPPHDSHAIFRVDVVVDFQYAFNCR